MTTLSIRLTDQIERQLAEQAPGGKIKPALKLHAMH